MKTSDRHLLKGYYWNHDAIRKDMAKLSAIIEKFDQYDSTRFNKLHDWFRYHEQCILAHHHGEDGFFFPIMREKQPDFLQQIDAMEHEHVALDEGLATLNKLFKELGSGNFEQRNEFIKAANKYVELVISHLDKEEVIVESVIKELPEAEVLKTEMEYRKQIPRSEMQLLLPWMVDAMDEKDKKYFFGMVPFFVKWIYKFSAKPKFEKMISVI